MPLRPYAVSAEADPAVTTRCGFDIIHTLSTRHQWFPCGLLLASHLTWFFPGLFLLCSRPWLLTTAAGGGLEPAPASRFRGTSPHQLSSCTLRGPFGPLCARGAQSSAYRTNRCPRRARSSSSSLNTLLVNPSKKFLQTQVPYPVIALLRVAPCLHNRRLAAPVRPKPVARFVERRLGQRVKYPPPSLPHHSINTLC